MLLHRKRKKKKKESKPTIVDPRNSQNPTQSNPKIQSLVTLVQKKMTTPALHQELEDSENTFFERHFKEKDICRGYPSSQPT